MSSAPTGASPPDPTATGDFRPPGPSFVEFKMFLKL